MKREAGEDRDFDAQMKKAKVGDTEIRLLIPSKSAGSVIGKGGQNISRLRNEYNASIVIPDCLGPERVLTIQAGEEDALNVLHEAIPLLDEVVQTMKSPSTQGTEVRMLVHQSQAGSIIGKGGSRIKELRDETGANIRIYGISCPQSTDRVVQITGEPEVILNCIRSILHGINSNPAKGPVNRYDPHHYDEYFAPEYGGWGDASKASKRAAGSIPPPGNSPMGRPEVPPVHISHGHMHGGRGGGAMGPGPGIFTPVHHGGIRPPPPDSVMGDPKPLLSMNGSDGEPVTQQVTIPKEYAGAIIGKGGARIRKIRNDSGAGISIEEALPGSNERLITITGTPTQINLAQYLMQQSVREHGGYGRRY